MDKPDNKRNILIGIIDIFLKARIKEQSRIKIYKNIPFPVCIEILKSFYKDYKEYVDFMIDNKIVKQVHHASEGSCTKYRFLEPYSNDNLSIQIIYKKGKTTPKNLFKTSVDTQLKSQYNYLYNSFKQVSVDWDYILPILEKMDDKQYRESLRQKLYNIDNFDGETEHLSTFKIGKTKRLFTPFSNIKKDIRPAFLIGGKRMIELDISNSIPFFSLSIFNNLDGDIDSLFLELINNSFYLGERSKGVNMLHQNETIETEFISSVLDGTLYNKLATLWNNNRDNAKQIYLTLCNMPLSILKHKTEWHQLKEIYPNVVATIEEINKDYIYKENTCQYAHLTQLLEAYFILEAIPQAIQETFPKQAIITLHDAIYVSENAEEIKQIMIDTIYNKTGYKPTIKVKDLQPISSSELGRCA